MSGFPWHYIWETLAILYALRHLAKAWASGMELNLINYIKPMHL